MNGKPEDSGKANGIRGKYVFVAIGLMMLGTLPFLPWLFRGMNQSSAESAVLAVGGRASYGKRLFAEGDYVTDEKQQGKSLLHDLLGDAFTETLTQVELRKELSDRSVLGKLERLHELEILDASGANFGDKELTRFRECVTLKKFWLNGSDVTNVGLKSIANLPELLSLSLEDTAIDDEGMDSINQCQRLRRLYLANTGVTNVGVGKLATLSQLLGIGLEGTTVNDGVMDHLVKMTELEEVRLGDTSIADVGAARLAALPKLESLYLENTKVTTQGLGWMANAAELKVVDLSGTNVTDDIIDVLAGVPNLASVSLRNTSVSNDAIAELRQRRKGAVTVQSSED